MEPEQYGNLDDESALYGELLPNHSIPEVDYHDVTNLVGFYGFQLYFLMIVVYPLALLTNMIFLIMIFKTAKIRSEPWTWLMAHTSISILVVSFFQYVNHFTTIFHLPSFETTLLCPATKIIESLFRQMLLVSVTLVMTERFRAMRENDWNLGGMGKKGVIIPLVIFWILNIAVNIINYAMPRDWDEFRPYAVPNSDGLIVCSYTPSMVTQIAQLVFQFWSGITALVVMIGSSIMLCQKPDVAMKKSVIIPTLIYSIIYFLFCFLFYISDMISVEFNVHVVVNRNILVLFHALVVFAWTAFPLIWLIAWSKNGEINVCPCLCPPDADEEIQLLESN